MPKKNSPGCNCCGPATDPNCPTCYENTRAGTYVHTWADPEQVLYDGFAVDKSQCFTSEANANAFNCNSSDPTDGGTATEVLDPGGDCLYDEDNGITGASGHTKNVEQSEPRCGTSSFGTVINWIAECFAQYRFEGGARMDLGAAPKVTATFSVRETYHTGTGGHSITSFDLEYELPTPRDCSLDIVITVGDMTVVSSTCTVSGSPPCPLAGPPAALQACQLTISAL